MLNPLRLLIRLDHLMSRIESFLLASVLLLALTLSFLQVILRNFFDSGINWGDVLARHLVLWIGFFGATLATITNHHIRIDAVSKILPDRAKPIVNLFICCFCIIVGYLLFNSAYRFVVMEKMSGTTLFEGIPTWYFIIIMPAGFAIITFRYFMRLIDLLYTFSGKKFDVAKRHEPSELDISVKIKLK